MQFSVIFIDIQNLQNLSFSVLFWTYSRELNNLTFGILLNKKA